MYVLFKFEKILHFLTVVSPFLLWTNLLFSSSWSGFTGVGGLLCVQTVPGFMWFHSLFYYWNAVKILCLLLLQGWLQIPQNLGKYLNHFVNWQKLFSKSKRKTFINSLINLHCPGLDVCPLLYHITHHCLCASIFWTTLILSIILRNIRSHLISWKSLMFDLGVRDCGNLTL